MKFPIFQSLSLSLSLSLSQSPYVSISLLCPKCVCVYVRVSLSISVCLCPFFCLSLSLSLSLRRPKCLFRHNCSIFDTIAEPKKRINGDTSVRMFQHICSENVSQFPISRSNLSARTLLYIYFLNSNIHACMHTFVYTCMHAYIWLNVNILNINIPACMHTFICTCMHSYARKNIHIRQKVGHSNVVIQYKSLLIYTCFFHINSLFSYT